MNQFLRLWQKMSLLSGNMWSTCLNHLPKKLSTGWKDIDAASDSISKLSKARNDLFILGGINNNFDTERNGQYETF